MTSKAGEVKLEFKYYDVTTVKTYFQNKSIEQLIHEVQRKKTKRFLFSNISQEDGHNNKTIKNWKLW